MGGCLRGAAVGSGSSTSQAISALVGTGSSPTRAREIGADAPAGVLTVVGGRLGALSLMPLFSVASIEGASAA
jgi:hypothetical protein